MCHYVFPTYGPMLRGSPSDVVKDGPCGVGYVFHVQFVQCMYQIHYERFKLKRSWQQQHGFRTSGSTVIMLPLQSTRNVRSEAHRNKIGTLQKEPVCSSNRICQLQNPCNKSSIFTLKICPTKNINCPTKYINCPTNIVMTC